MANIDAQVEMGDVELASDRDQDSAHLLTEGSKKQWPWKRAEFDNGPAKTTYRLAWCLVVARNVLLVSLALLGIYGLGHKLVDRIRGPPMGYKECHCGHSTAEAKDMGCAFDLLGPAWLPGKCRDDKLTAEFMKAGSGPNGTWEFWKDHEHTIPMTLEEVSLIPDDPDGAFYGTWEFHVKHCTYQWRKFIRAMEKGVINLDMENTGTGHVDHCEMVILNGFPVRATIPLNIPEKAA
ncbi:hypothetical protein LTR65_009341 [Meristemomyces frigidus]